MAGTNVTLPQAGDEVTATWGQDVAKGLNGIQSGIAVGTTTASGTLDVPFTFAKPYASAPVVIVTTVGAPATLAGMASYPTATGANVRFFKRDGTNFTAGQSVAAEWIAVGPLA